MTKTDLNEIATHYHLGSLLETSNWDGRQAKSSIWSNSITAIAGLILLVSIFPIVQKEFLKESLSMSIFLIGLLGLIIMGITFFTTRIRQEIRKLGTRAISVFEHGFVDERNPKVEVFLYQNIVEIWQYRVQVGGGGYFSSYNVIQKDGSKCYLDEKIEDVDQLGSSLQQVCLTYQLPPLVKSFQAGENLEFDQIALNQQGIIIQRKDLCLDRLE
ncbi:MAG: hypothetical protein KME11_22800 [Timaviella obliquedivisa GSE-PSE-MK23-08B]|jgi:hypothetical protein|nr:hypothetical protein [Timaviella obliquedivisa GSE-PSE-MK23-08B]